MKAIRSMVLFGVLALAGCATNPFTGKTISAADVQTAAVAACGFLPTVQTVTAIVAAAAGAGAAVVGAEQIAQQICNAVIPVKLAGKLGVVQPTVNGVAVHGRFVK